jgi:hypothetical protein
MQTLTIGPADWVRGVSTSDKHNDGGFSPLMKGHNLELYQDNLLLPQPTHNNLSNKINSSIITLKKICRLFQTLCLWVEI